MSWDPPAAADLIKRAALIKHIAAIMRETGSEVRYVSKVHSTKQLEWAPLSPAGTPTTKRMLPPQTPHTSFATKGKWFLFASCSE
jgi:hypothetical protein